MPVEALLALCAFSVITSITPGPNNLMLLASGVNFGFARTLPHTLGISLGFMALLLAVGAGLGGLLTAVPALHVAFKIASALWLLYLAWKLAMSRELGEAREGQARPMRFIEAAGFQWVNPKAWIMALSGMALYADPSSPLASVIIVAVVFSLLNWPCVSIWAGFGVMLRTFLSGEARLRWFNRLMGALLALTVVPLLID
jgi:threonine/homoserine/homoserine lactone efflux protein